MYISYDELSFAYTFVIILNDVPFDTYTIENDTGCSYFNPSSPVNKDFASIYRAA
ncbi:hypothetical protein TCA2_2898 [Paenibacillus sp. TCA20]|nr:hypothetical protein TCA2_2898 [Paenibacillus sp. TCA20]